MSWLFSYFWNVKTEEQKPLESSTDQKLETVSTPPSLIPEKVPNSISEPSLNSDTTVDNEKKYLPTNNLNLAEKLKLQWAQEEQKEQKEPTTTIIIYPPSPPPIPTYLPSIPEAVEHESTADLSIPPPIPPLPDVSDFHPILPPPIPPPLPEEKSVMIFPCAAITFPPKKCFQCQVYRRKNSYHFIQWKREEGICKKCIKKAHKKSITSN